jgi:hypothetical protein
MTEIKRYDHDYSVHWEKLVEDPQGEWVRWDDVKDLIAIADDVLDVFKVYCENMKHPELFAFLRGEQQSSPA